MEPKTKAKFIKIYTTDINMSKLISTIPKNTSSNMHGDRFCEFLTKRIYDLCKNTILPDIDAILNNKINKKEKGVSLKEVLIEDSDFSNIELLEKFAEYHKTSVSEIIYMYILFPILAKEYLEKKINF